MLSKNPRLSARLVEAKLTPDTGDLWKIVWSLTTHGARQEFPPYSISSTKLKTDSATARTSLEELVEYLHLTEAGWRTCGLYLDQLAKAGNYLRASLFTAADESLVPGRVLKWLKQSPATINVVLENIPHSIPWGLMCWGDETPNGHEYPDERFWCLRHSCSATYRRIWPTLETTNISPESFFLQPVINPRVWQGVDGFLHTDTKAANCKLPWLDTIHSKSLLFSTWKQSLRVRSGMLYFLCHASDENLELSEVDILTPTEIQHELARSNDGGQGCLVFLNGCSTATTATRAALLNAVQGDSFLGCIACEGPVPDVFAAAFGIDLLSRWHASGDSLLAAMEDVLRQHWPLSLLYGVHCYPYISTSGFPKARNGAINLSREKIVSIRLLSRCA